MSQKEIILETVQEYQYADNVTITIIDNGDGSISITADIENGKEHYKHLSTKELEGIAKKIGIVEMP